MPMHSLRSLRDVTRCSLLDRQAGAAAAAAIAAPVFASSRDDLNGEGKGAMAGSRGAYQLGLYDKSGAATSVGKDTKARKNPFQGKFSDPAHSDMTRAIEYAGGRDYQISGADEDKKPWKVFGKRKNSDTLIVDFTPKGGPAEVVAKVQVGGDIKFPDGNVWKRLD